MRLLPFSFTACAGLLLGCALIAPRLQAAAPEGFKEIFNGHDLTGWAGNQKVWRVRDGALTGQTTAENALEGNTFLVWQGGKPANFELRVSFRLTGQNDKGFANSGVQYRSKLLDPAAFVVGGYQADMDLAGQYTGMLYEERGRGILMAPGEKIRIAAAAPDAKKPTITKLAVLSPPPVIHNAYKAGDWNELVIIADGNHVRHLLNGVLTADVTDDDAALAPHDGVIALQLHKGPPMTVEFKSLVLKTLP